VAQGPLSELRSQGAVGQTLEDLFLTTIGAGSSAAPSLDWLSR
jgi:hypothetical protein